MFMKKKFFRKRVLAVLLAAMLGIIGMAVTVTLHAAAPQTVNAQTSTVSTPAQPVNPGKGSIMLDTASYSMAPGDRYTIGTYLKGADGKEMDGKQVRALARANVLSVRDSRTGSVVSLSQQQNGNFVVTGKNEGTCYIIYEIGGTHASIRIDVKKGTKAGGSAVRNTSYFTQELPEVKPLPEGPMIALTFDDGPNGKTTQKIVSILQANDAKATFFMVGNRISGDKETVRKVYQSGSEIASHSYSHANLAGLSAAGIRSELQQTQNLVRSVVPFTPTLVRPPYGAYNSTVQKAGAPLILWSIDTLDWQHRNSAKTVQAVLNSVKEGDIILMHDLQPSTATACETLIPALKKRGFQLVTVSELIEARTGKEPVAGKVYTKV